MSGGLPRPSSNKRSPYSQWRKGKRTNQDSNMEAMLMQLRGQQQQPATIERRSAGFKQWRKMG